MSIDLDKLNAAVREDPAAFLARCDAAYDARVFAAAARLKENLGRSPIVLLLEECMASQPCLRPVSGRTLPAGVLPAI